MGFLYTWPFLSCFQNVMRFLHKHLPSWGTELRSLRSTLRQDLVLRMVSIDKTSSLHISTRCALLAPLPLKKPSLSCFSKEGLTFPHLLEWAWSSLQSLERRRPWTSDLPCFLPALGKAAAATTFNSHTDGARKEGDLPTVLEAQRKTWNSFDPWYYESI